MNVGIREKLERDARGRNEAPIDLFEEDFEHRTLCGPVSSAAEFLIDPHDSEQLVVDDRWAGAFLLAFGKRADEVRARTIERNAVVIAEWILTERYDAIFEVWRAMQSAPAAEVRDALRAVLVRLHGRTEYATGLPELAVLEGPDWFTAQLAELTEQGKS